MILGSSGTMALGLALAALVAGSVALAALLRREGRHARRPLSGPWLRELLDRTDCMTWEATVQKNGERLDWGFRVPPSGLYRRLIGKRPRHDEMSLWWALEVEDQQEMDARSRAALLGGALGYEQEIRVRRPDREIWLEERVSIRRISPERWNLVGVITDVTSRHERERELRLKERQVQQILGQADCLLWRATVRRRGNDVAWLEVVIPDSALCRRIFGRSPAPSEGLPWNLMNVPELPEMHTRSREAILLGAPGYSQEFRAVKETGTLWLREQVSILPCGASDDSEYLLIGVIVDDTARRVAETSLAAEKERLVVTLRAMADGVILADTEGRVLYLNRAAAELAEWEIGQATGHAVAEVCDLKNEADGQPICLPAGRKAQESGMFYLPPSTTLTGRGGTRRLVAGCSAAVRTAAGELVGSVLVFRDITDQERLRKELARASRLESVGILAGGIAHDFNNILTIILGNLDLSLLDAPPGSQQENALREAVRGTLRARELTQQLLTFARGGEPIRAAVCLPELLHEVAGFALHGSRVRAVYELAGDLWMADVDKGQIGQVVQNLVINSVQAMPDGGVVRLLGFNECVPVGRRDLEPGDYVHLVVADTGVGIRAEDLGRIFDPYFTTKRRGSGLGLATVYSIIKRHRGAVDVESQPGKGSSFHVWLPALPKGIPDAPVRDDGEGFPIRGSVLFMDDEEPILRMAATLLTRIGLEVTTALDGNEAVSRYIERRVSGHPFDLVMVDLTVPGGMGGREVLEALRSIDPGVKVIVSSGYASDPVLANHRAMGFAGMIAKPYEIAEVSRILRKVMGEPEV